MSEALKKRFDQSVAAVKELPVRPTNDELLDLYSLFKQSTEGDVRGERPGFLDVKGRAKYAAWSKRRGVASDVAMESYVTYVQKLTEKYKK